ncbi:MAG: hypothetical protein ACXWZS_10475 [Gemmatirosa sp.]
MTLDRTSDQGVMLIDAYLPAYDVRERHRTRVLASPTATYAALQTADLAEAPLVRALLGLRALPAALARGGGGLQALWARKPEPIPLAAFEARGFRILQEAPPTELVIGLEGQFWRPRGDLCTPSAAVFRTQPPAPGMARAVWNFAVATAPDGTTTLTTETRVLCADAAARRAFLPYWYVIRPGSGVIRHAMLRAIRRAAEAARDPHAI